MKQDWEISVRCSGRGNDNSVIGCSPCGENLNIKEKDVFITYRKFWDGEKLPYYSVKCPQCGSITDIDERRVPQEVKSAVLAKSNAKRDELAK